MVEQANTLNVAIVGGGPGCKAIMDMIFAEKLSQLRMNLIGVADINPEAVGYRYAREKGIFTTTEYHDLYKLEGLNMIIELTGVEKVADEILRTKPERVRLMGNVAARLFWDIFQIEEERIAERQRAEEARRKSEHEKEAILNSMSEEVVYHDTELRIVWANKVASERIDLVPDELVGRHCYEIFHRRSKPCPGCPVVKARETGQPQNAEMTSPDGRIWFVRGIPVRAANDNIAGVVEVTLEITNRKRAEEAIRDSEEKYRTVLEACPDSVVVYDIAGNVIYINQAFARVFGWTPKELLGKKIDYVPDENWPETRTMIDKVLAGESFSRVESRRYTKEGKILDVSISVATYLDHDGIPVGSVHTLRDITRRKLVELALQKAHDELEQRVEERTAELARATEQLKLELIERKRTEEALRLAHKDLAIKADDLEAANEELSQYASVVSHDLKAPLRAIRNYTDFLSEDLEGTLDGDQKTYFNGLNRAVLQGEELVEDLLELSQVGTRGGPAATIDTGVFLLEVIASLGLSPDVEVVIGNDCPTIDTDPTLLRQIFQNLIKNAVKFNHSPRKRIEIGWRPVGEKHYELFVRDNGIGIEPRYHEQIFRVFHRLHTSKEYPGTGLGLAIVKKAASKLHGSVRLESEFGEGSTFFVALPKTQKER
jgi:PAS domain S-box-containing protein